MRKGCSSLELLTSERWQRSERKLAGITQSCFFSLINHFVFLMRRLFILCIFFCQLSYMKGPCRKACRHLPTFGEVWELLKSKLEFLQNTTAKAGTTGAETSSHENCQFLSSAAPFAQSHLHNTCQVSASKCWLNLWMTDKYTSIDNGSLCGKASFVPQELLPFFKKRVG